MLMAAHMFGRKPGRLQTTLKAYSTKTVYWFVWDKVKFLHSSLYKDAFWICAGNRDVLVIAEQLLHIVKAFSAPHTSHQQRGCGCTRSWEGTHWDS